MIVVVNTKVSEDVSVLVRVIVTINKSIVLSVVKVSEEVVVAVMA